LSAQESHYEDIRAAIFELRRDLFDRLDRIYTREEDFLALKRRMDEIERTVSSGFAEMHHSLQMVLDRRRDTSLLQRSVNGTMRRVQTLEGGQPELRKDVQELKAGQQRIAHVLQQILTKLG
jgi:tetrahydromethanopterin S-methyltransferase subunit G